MESNVESKVPEKWEVSRLPAPLLISEEGFCRIKLDVHCAGSFSPYFSLKLTEVGDLLQVD